MFNIILALATGILIGWNFHSFFLALNRPNILRTDFNISELLIQEKNATQESNSSTILVDNNNSNSSKTIAITPSTKKIAKAEETEPPLPSIKSSFYSLLHNGLFSDAMALYQEAGDERVLHYRSTLLRYFKEEKAKDKERTIREILEYEEIESENHDSLFILSQIYHEQKEYKKEITILNELLEESNQIDYKVQYSALIDASTLYLESLKKLKDYSTIKTFLEGQILNSPKSAFFTLSLAKHLIFMQSFPNAIILLKEIEFDEEYGEDAKRLLAKLENKNAKNQEEYEYKFPLKKEGSHFTIEVTIDDTPLTLLLDTGASITLIDEEKLLSSLTLLNDNITLKTAGGEVSAQLKVAQSLTLGKIKIENFKVTTSAFTQDKADGLLGMNFFERFKFKIDQEKGLLYLSNK